IGWLSATFSPQAALTPLPTGTRGYWYTAGQAAISFLETIPERRLNITLPNAPQADAAFMKMAPKTAWQIAETQLQRDPLSQSTARIAAVDDLLKRMIVAIEDDFDRFFVQPLLQDMRVIVNRSKVDFGVIQRTSILATNRMVARVDTNASANANIQTQQDFLQQATQLAQIGQGIGLRNVARAAEGAATAYTASKLAFNGSGKDLGSLAAGIISLFNGLATLPQDPGEIYSVNSGDLIQVTPIFDPSGQALRFKFDFAGTVNVQEPNGTRTRQLPRVERHTINTEVQLSNLELREISRFETNSKIGVPERRSGGIPLLKELNYIKDIPLIGYFVRQAGSAAIRQESLILGQTTIYPTIAEIIDLLLESSRGRANETPDELK
ncbi:MAG: hypothetical protein NT023_21020, partial [Armatimonadetes bacterium]|nr:hypothetical protein [Armatimonadota bacterium]